MGPDDPAIIRKITISDDNQNVTYSLIIQPCPIIIDDVILKDSVDNIWLIMDRNIQVTTISDALYEYACRDSEGNKRQSYNYNDEIEITIPFKYKDNAGTPFSENMHVLYMGDMVAHNYLENGKLEKRREDWLNRYLYSNQSDLTSNFYDKNNLALWVFPNIGVIKLCCEKMKMTKMRMYLISDVYARQGDEYIPICCYWPYIGENKKENDWYKKGYTIADYSTSEITPEKNVYVYYDGEQVKCYEWKNDDFDSSLSRLVRPLTAEELEDYQWRYLGYGSHLRLSICHPDTYGSPGWLPY